MEQKNKDLLIRDLCARLPYGVKAVLKRTNCHKSTKHKVNEKDIYSFRTGKPLEEDYGQHDYYKVVVTDIKPYLFPMSSLTEKQKKYITDRWGINEDFDFEIDPNWGNFSIELGEVVGFINWCYENHFDINSLIPRELANDATGLNIY